MLRQLFLCLRYDFALVVKDQSPARAGALVERENELTGSSMKVCGHV